MLIFMGETCSSFFSYKWPWVFIVTKDKFPSSFSQTCWVVLLGINNGNNFPLSPSPRIFSVQGAYNSGFSMKFPMWSDVAFFFLNQPRGPRCCHPVDLKFLNWSTFCWLQCIALFCYENSTLLKHNVVTLWKKSLSLIYL